MFQLLGRERLKIKIVQTKIIVIIKREQKSSDVWKIIFMIISKQQMLNHPHRIPSFLEVVRNPQFAYVN